VPLSAGRAPAGGQRQIRHAERTLHAACQRLQQASNVRARNLLDISRDRAIRIVQRQELVSVARREIIRDLRRNGQQRPEIQICVRHRKHQVRRARPERRQHDARLAP
jgi:hypothetical protein